MWSYHGAKTNVIDLYPKPKEKLIIEPFAGTARYSLKYFEHDVLLVDKYEVIIKIWKWLQLCSEKDILTLPRRLKPGESLDDYSFDCEEAKMLMGFLVSYGLESPRKIVTDKHLHRPNYLNFSLMGIARSLFKIKHWKFLNDSYENTENRNATWFIDAPYQLIGSSYVHSSKNINFSHLAKWSNERLGHVIVCESNGADWMDFKTMATHKGRNGIQKEVIWSNRPTNFDNVQGTLYVGNEHEEI